MSSYQENINPADNSEFLENLTVLREVPFFSEFPIEVLKVFAYLCTREAYREGDIIFSQDDDDGCAYCILSGMADLGRKHEDSEVFIRTCGENSFFGAFTLTSMVSRLYTLKSKGDTCCLVLSREHFQEAIAQFPETRQHIIQGLINNVISWEKSFLNKNMGCNSCRESLGVSLI